MIRFGNLRDILGERQFTSFLVDASGVLYNDSGSVPNISRTIAHLQSLGDVFLATNNSSQSPPSIKRNLESIGIFFEQSRILSSGMGLHYDEKISQLIANKRCYVVGYLDSHYYVKLAGGDIVTSLEDAECIVLTASIEASIRLESTALLEFCHRHPDIPVVCCNPDHFVRGLGQTKVSVIGYYASLLELEIKNPFYWVGKPHPNYSHMVSRLLTQYRVPFGQNTLFFDDNPENVVTMQNELDIIGCLIKDTGISHEFSLERAPDGHHFIYWCIPSLVY